MFSEDVNVIEDNDESVTGSNDALNWTEGKQSINPSQDVQEKGRFTSCNYHLSHSFRSTYLFHYVQCSPFQAVIGIIYRTVCNSTCYCLK